jgi:hypothetical protein
MLFILFLIELPVITRLYFFQSLRQLCDVTFFQVEKIIYFERIGCQII